MLADWLHLYHLHPFRNDLDDAERELLSRELVITATSRTYAAISTGPPLDLWLQLRLAGMVASALGEELELPSPEAPREPKPPAAELNQMRQRLRRHSVIAELPEE